MREKLIELFEQEHERCQNTLCDECKYDNAADCGVDALVDYLIANGVTVLDCQRDCKSCWKTQLVTHKWIPVSERLPEADKNVLVCTIHGSFKVARCNFYKNGTEVSWATNDGLGERAITHWMPLPEPPKEE